MAFDPKSLTIDYQTLMNSTSISDRVAMTKSAQGRQVLSSLDPSDMASIFPDYYKKSNPDVSGFIEATSRRYGRGKDKTPGAEYSEEAKGDNKGGSSRNSGASGGGHHGHDHGGSGSGLGGSNNTSYAVEKLKAAFPEYDPNAKARLSKEKQDLIDELKKGNIRADDPRVGWIKGLSPDILKQAGIAKTAGKNGDDPGFFSYIQPTVTDEEVKKGLPGTATPDQIKTFREQNIIEQERKSAQALADSQVSVEVPANVNPTVRSAWAKLTVVQRQGMTTYLEQVGVEKFNKAFEEKIKVGELPIPRDDGPEPKFDIMQGRKGAAGNPKSEEVKNNLIDVKTSYGNIRVHKEAAVAFQGFYGDLFKAGAPIDRLGSLSVRMKRPAGGSHNPNTNEISSHSYGMATDLNDSKTLSEDFKNWLKKPGNKELLENAKKEWGMLTPKDDEPHMEYGGRISKIARARVMAIREEEKTKIAEASADATSRRNAVATTPPGALPSQSNAQKSPASNAETSTASNAETSNAKKEPPKKPTNSYAIKTAEARKYIENYPDTLKGIGVYDKENGTFTTSMTLAQLHKIIDERVPWPHGAAAKAAIEPSRAPAARDAAVATVEPAPGSEVKALALGGEIRDVSGKSLEARALPEKNRKTGGNEDTRLYSGGDPIGDINKDEGLSHDPDKNTLKVTPENRVKAEGLKQEKESASDNTNSAAAVQPQQETQNNSNRSPDSPAASTGASAEVAPIAYISTDAYKITQERLDQGHFGYAELNA